MLVAFYKRFPRARSHWREGTTALVLSKPEPAWLTDGALLFLVRFAVRKGRPYKQRLTSSANRLVERRVDVTLYSVDRYEYAVVHWTHNAADPEIISNYDSKVKAAQALEAEIAERA